MAGQNSRLLSLVLIAACLGAAPGSPRLSQVGPAASASWLIKQNIYVYFQPPLDYLSTVGASGTTWSVYYPGQSAADLAYVDLLHEAGYRVGSNFPTIQAGITTDKTLQKTACCRDIHNKPSTCVGGQYLMCINNPSWQAFLKARIKNHIDGKIDAVHLDEVASIGTDGNGGFCASCLAALNDYLKTHYTAAELASKFGIMNIEAFNYRTYLLAHGAANIWEDPNESLRSEYLQSQYLARAKAVHKLIQYARGYGRGKVLFSGNLYGLRPSQQVVLADLDFVVFETSLGKLPAGKVFTTCLLAEAMAPSKPFVAFPDIFDLGALSAQDWRLFQHWMAEAYACGASFLIPYQAYSSGDPYTLPADKIAPTTSFIKQNQALYKNASRPAQIGLYHDLYSLNTNTVCWKAHVGWADFLGMGLKLQEAHCPFGVVYKGDPRYYAKPLTLADLAKYAVVVLPLHTYLDAATQGLFAQFTARGGKILKADDFPAGSDVVAEVRKTGLDPGLATNASKDLGIVISKRSGTLIIHFLNYKYNYGTHAFSVQRNIRVTAALPSGIGLSGKKLTLLSPDAAGPATLAYSVQDGKVTFTVPKVSIYSVAVFR